MSILIAHLSDAHLKSSKDPLMQRIPQVARVITSEFDGTVKACVIAFTGDITDRGSISGFGVAREFFKELFAEINKTTNCVPELLMVPGNHDLVTAGDTSVRDTLISSLTPAVMEGRPKDGIEKAILAPLDSYFDLVESLSVPSPTRFSPYYAFVDKQLDGKIVRFHLLNSSWMCKREQGGASLYFPLPEIKPANSSHTVEYQITLLHHPFGWFKQPEAMRPIRDALEKISDMIMTGHEHVGRLTKTDVYGLSAIEYREGEALQGGNSGQESGFHLLRIDFQQARQFITTYKWAAGTYTKVIGTIESPQAGRSLRRPSHGFRVKDTFAGIIDDPELPVMHPKQGKLRLSDFYSYPDVKKINDKEERLTHRLPGNNVPLMIAGSPKMLFLGPDRCGKTSFAKRLFLDIHTQGRVPVLLKGGLMGNLGISKLAGLLETKLKEQYETIAPETYWQLSIDQRVLVLDDLQHLPYDRAAREELMKELGRRFGAILIIGSDEFYLDEMLSIAESDRAANALWSYDHYRILPFGYQRREDFVRKWVGLDNTQDQSEAQEKAKQINALLTRFLRTNPIPQFPWVIVIIVQAADSPEPLHAENGSYGYLLQALITAALAKSRLKLPIQGKYRWLAELANELYTANRSFLNDFEARAVHDRYRQEYGVPDLEFKEISTDLATAGVLRIEGNEVSFRQPYIYCYFVAWHLAQRIHSGDSIVREQIKRLWKDLYHEDTANVLVFLAHLTTSPIALEEMITRATELFADSKETDLVTDVGRINALCHKSHQLVLPPGEPHENKRHMQRVQDDEKAQRDSEIVPKREVTLKPAPESHSKQTISARQVMDIVTAFRAIEILGQVLRNEATARKVESLMEITDQVFRLGRRIIGFLLATASEQIDVLSTAFERHYRERMPKADPNSVKDEANWHIFTMYTTAAFAIVKSVAVAVGDRNLKEVFHKLVKKDPNLPNRIYDMAINFELSLDQLPLREVEELHDEVVGKTRGKIHVRGKPRTLNNFARMLINALVIDYLYMNHVSQPKIQALCEKLDIKTPTSSANPVGKRLPPKKRK